jgi:hypothetical protein
MLTTILPQAAQAPTTDGQETPDAHARDDDLLIFRTFRNDLSPLGILFQSPSLTHLTPL